ncbi:hypothetical protein EX30DRAFT_375624 [Ascodesmis nigricans]|uniref:Uncharacterized protein n=1 Tax=Ascodesmis nigricans TaxID=341454 RepID=A0A4V3SHH3_9PEZI|nr:hypothetical protein EX30DRAFT_375624 [Ascodesmis nigricans]
MPSPSPIPRDPGATNILSLLSTKSAAPPTPYQAAENITTLLDTKASSARDQGGMEAVGRVEAIRGGRGGRGEEALRAEHVNFVDPSVGAVRAGGAAGRSRL